MKINKFSGLIVGLGLGVLFFGPGNFWSATWLSKWALLMGYAGLAFSFWASRRTSYWYLPLFAYVMTSLLVIAVSPEQPYKELLDPVTTLALQKNALYGVLIWVSSVTAFVCCTGECTLAAFNLMALIWAFGVFGTLALPLTGNHSPPNNGMWFGNPSMGASLLACLLPIVWDRLDSLVPGRFVKLFKTICWLLTFAAIYRTKASVPWGVLGVVTAAYLVANSPRKKILIATALLGAAMIFFGQIALGHDFWDQNGRFEIWQMGWEYFRYNASPLFGFGYSTTQILLPIEQVMTGHFKGDYFLWFHNDWLQLAIEGGAIGMLCVLLAAFHAARNLLKYPMLFASFAGFCTLALFNYPLRMPLHCMALVTVLAAGDFLARIENKAATLLVGSRIRSEEICVEKIR